MNFIEFRIVRALRRPLPELSGILRDRLVSWLWRVQLQSVGKRFHVSRGTLLQGGSNIRIGDRFYAGQMLWIEAVKEYCGIHFNPLIEIGNNVTCSQRVHIAATRRVTIGNGVLFGSGVHVTDHGHGTYRGSVQDRPDIPPAMRPLAEGRPVVVGNNVWFGDNVIVLPGVTIGEGSIIGANSVVTKSIPSYTMAVGSPAMPIKKYSSSTHCWEKVAAQ